jgi:hypothetical protein
MGIRSDRQNDKTFRAGFTMTMLLDGTTDSANFSGDASTQSLSTVLATAGRRGAMSRDEAEYLFLMDRSGAIGGQGSLEAAVRAVRDHLVIQTKPEGQVSETDVDWLLGMVGDRPTAFGRAVVFAVVRACDSAPPRLSEMAMRAAVGRCLLV